MSTQPPTDGNSDDGPTPTLGALLYSGRLPPPVSESNWTELVDAIAGGDQQALRELYARTNHLVFTLILRLVHDRETAEEATLDVYLGVWQRAGTYDRESGSVVAWIMNQARSRAIDRLRHETRLKRSNPFPNEAPADHDVVDHDRRRNMDDRRRLLEGGLAVLSRDERHAIEAAYFRDETYVEVAERLGHPLGTIKTRIRSGLAKLRDALADKREDL